MAQTRSIPKRVMHMGSIQVLINMIGKQTLISSKCRNQNKTNRHLIILTINSPILREIYNNKHLLLSFNLNKKFLQQLISLSSLSEDNPTGNHLNHSHNSLHSHLLLKLKVHSMPLELQMLAKQPMEDRKVQIHFKIFSNKAVRISLLTQVANKITNLQVIQAVRLITLDNNQLQTTYRSNKKLLHNSRSFNNNNNLQYNNKPHL